MTIGTNRAGGVSIRNQKADTIDFFLTRKIDNVNMDKGLPNRLEDTKETRSEFIINIGRTDVIKKQKRINDHMNDRLVLIEPMYVQQVATDKALYTLANIDNAKYLEMKEASELFDLDLIDVLYYNHSSYIRMRNYQGQPLIINKRFRV